MGRTWEARWWRRFLRRREDVRGRRRVEKKGRCDPQVEKDGARGGWEMTSSDDVDNCE
jgi:hypothetical protein